MNLFKKLILPLLILVLLSTGISFLLINQKPANAQAGANSILAQTCTGTAPAHAMLVMDRSGSMDERIGGANTPKKLVKAKEAAKLFVDKLKNNNTKTRIGMVRFGNDAQLVSAFSTDWNGIKTQIDALTANGETCAACGLKKAKEEINAKHENGVKDVVIFLTDGKANNTLDNKRDPARARQEAIEQAQQIKQRGGIIYSIGLGPEVQPDFLKSVATDPSKYFPSPTTQQLNQIYDDIAQLVGGGSIAGVVFNDVNNNGNKDSGEAGLSGWTVNLGGAATANTTSGTNGAYEFEGLCDGSYTVSETPQDGWTQTKPTNPNNYPVTISSTNSTVTDKDFGNVQKPACNRGDNGEPDGTCGPCQAPANSCGPNNGTRQCEFTTHDVLGDFCRPVTQTRQCTINMCSAGSHCDQSTNPYQCKPDPTPEPGTVNLNFVLGLDGIGGEEAADNTKGTGDFSNRNLTFGNSDPNFDDTKMQVCLYPNTQNDENFCTNPYETTLEYNGSTELWTANLALPSSIRPGNYWIKVRAQKYLIRKVGLDIPSASKLNPDKSWALTEGNNTIGSFGANQSTHSNLMVGDVNGGDYGDNAINSVDWSLIKDCSVFKTASATCSSSAKADLNADGKVDQVDLNYFIRERATGDGGLPQSSPTPTPSVSPTGLPFPTTSPTQSPSATPNPSVGACLQAPSLTQEGNVAKNGNRITWTLRLKRNDTAASCPSSRTFSLLQTASNPVSLTYLNSNNNQISSIDIGKGAGKIIKVRVNTSQTTITVVAKARAGNQNVPVASATLTYSPNQTTVTEEQAALTVLDEE